MGLMMCEGKFVGRDEIAQVPTPAATASWKPVAHTEVIDAVTEVVRSHNWQILDEQYGLARDGQKMFGVMRINKTSSSDWSRCIGIRNSPDRTIAAGLAAGLSVICCSNLCLGGSMVLKRRHTSRTEPAFRARLPSADAVETTSFTGGVPPPCNRKLVSADYRDPEPIPRQFQLPVLLNKKVRFV